MAHRPPEAQDAYAFGPTAIVNSLHIFFLLISSHQCLCVFNLGPETTLPFPGWPGDARRLDTLPGPKFGWGPPAAGLLR